MPIIESTISQFQHNRREVYKASDDTVFPANRNEPIAPDVKREIVEVNQVFTQNSIPSDKLGVHDVGNAGISNVGIADSDIRIWAGALFGNRGTAVFRVDQAGNLFASSATISGAITGGTIDIGGSDATSFHVDVNGNMWLGAALFASAPFSVTSAGAIKAESGLIGGWTINATNIRTNNVIISSSSQSIVLGTGTNSIYLDATDATYRIAVGTNVYANATFSVDKTGALKSTAGVIGTWVISATTLASASNAVILDATNQKITVGSGSPNLIIDGANTRIRSSNYVANVSGFTVEPNLIEAENLRARGMMSGVTFKYDVVSAVGGQLMVANSDVLDADMTALDASTMTVSGASTFAANDMLMIRAITASGIQEEWLRVTSAASAPTYSVTRDLAGLFASNSNPAWGRGVTVVKQGKSDGAATYSGGWLRLFGEGTNSPYYSVYSRTGVTYNSYSEIARFGNLNGIGGFVADTFGIFIGDYSAGKFLSYDTVSGNLLLNNSPILNQDVFGDGSDGDVTISVDTSLSSDMFYRNLTVNSTKTLNCNGYRAFVSGTLTNNGTISRNGAAGGNGGNGTNATATTGTFNGGTAGAAPAALADGSLPGAPAGKAGFAGANGDGQLGGGYSHNAVAGTNGTNGTNATNAIVGAGADGGNGGNGGSATSAPSGGGSASGGTKGTGGTNTGTILNEIRSFVSAYLLYDQQTGTWYDSSGGSGSGGSGASGAASHNNDVTYGAGAGGGGGSGASGTAGGVVAIFARIIINSGVISANAGNGGNGGSAGTSAVAVNAAAGGSGGGGGGGGGDGGVIILVYSSYSGSGTITATAGTGGTGGAKSVGVQAGGNTGNDGSDGANGTNGTTGIIIQLQQ